VLPSKNHWPEKINEDVFRGCWTRPISRGAGGEKNGFAGLEIAGSGCTMEKNADTPQRTACCVAVQFSANSRQLDRLRAKTSCRSFKELMINTTVLLSAH
jgi:hypothetical protein